MWFSWASLRAVSRSPARELSNLSREAVGTKGRALVDGNPETDPLTPAERLPSQVTYSITATPVGRLGRKRRVGAVRCEEKDTDPFSSLTPFLPDPFSSGKGH